MQKYILFFIYASRDAFFSYFCIMIYADIIQQTVDALREGKTILYPTDTIWGVGCDARNNLAVNALYEIKERDHSKSMLILCSPDQLKDDRWVVAKGERPTTFILPAEIWQPALKVSIADNLPAVDGSLGIRVPNHPFCLEVMRLLGTPLVSTSANLSGRPSPRNYDEIEPDLCRRVDYCVPPIPEVMNGETQGSRIVKINLDGTTTVIRP